MFASFLGTAVEFVEALTIVLAVGAVRGWKNAMSGTFAAIVILAALVVIVGTPLLEIIQILWVQIIVGLFMLLFGIRWLRKAILRYSGLKALHDEAESFKEEMERQTRSGHASAKGIDRFAFMTTFSITMLEGLEAIFIVITIGLSSQRMGSAVTGAIIATVAVVLAGILLRKPLVKIPENTLKFIVGIMLTSFGAFWIGEGFRVEWPQEDVSIVYLAATLLLFSWIVVKRIKSKLTPAAAAPQSNSKAGAV
jgi:uncharacterized membrane protein